MSKHFFSPLIRALDRLQDPIPALPGPTACNLAPHSCAACKKCWRRCKPRCSRAKLRATSQTRCESLARPCPYLLPANLLSYPGLGCPAPNPEPQRLDPPLHLKRVPPIRLRLLRCSERTALLTPVGGFHFGHPRSSKFSSNKKLLLPLLLALLLVFFPAGTELPPTGLPATSQPTVSHSCLAGRCFNLP